jgi:hypothetical protein
MMMNATMNKLTMRRFYFVTQTGRTAYDDLDIAIALQNKARAAANTLRPPRYLTTVPMDGYKPEPDRREFCPACDVSITTTDFDAGNCTNCGVELISTKLTDV